MRAGEQRNRSVVDLLHRAGRLADELFTRCVGNSDITPRQYVVLAAIARSEGESQTAIVNTTGVDRATLSEMIRKLVKSGWVQRRRAKHDARAYAVRLTQAGRKALKIGEAAAWETDEKLLAALPAARRDQFVEALGRLAEVGGAAR